MRAFQSRHLTREEAIAFAGSEAVNLADQNYEKTGVIFEHSLFGCTCTLVKVTVNNVPMYEVR